MSAARTGWLRRTVGRALGLRAQADEFLRGNWTMLGGDRVTVTRPMEQNAAVYSGVRAIAQTIAGFPLVLYAGERDHVLAGGPAYDLLNEPARGTTWSALAEQWAGHYVEGGEAHLLLGAPTGAPRDLHVVSGRVMEAVRTEDRRLLYWRRHTGSRVVNVIPEEDAYARLFNPYDEVRGLSPLAAAALGIKQDYAASLYNCAALENGAGFGGAFIFPPGTDETEAKEYVRRAEGELKGPGRANKLFWLGGGVDYKQLAFKNTDLELFPGRKFSRDEIFNALGVPSVIVAIYESAHYDVADKSIEIFLMFTIAPLVTALEDTLNLNVLPRVQPGVRCYLDMTRHPVLQRVLFAKIEVLAKALKAGVPYNEAIAAIGLPFARQTWGDTSLIESGLATAVEVVAGLSAPAESETTAEDAEDAEDAEKTDGARGSGLGTAGRMPALPGPRTPDPGSQNSNTGRMPVPPSLCVSAVALDAERRSEERQIRAQMPMIRQRFRALWLSQERRLVARLRGELTGARGSGLGSPGAWNPNTGRMPVPPGGQDARTPRRRPWERAADDDAERVAKRILLSAVEEQTKLRGLVRDYFPRAVEATLRAELKRIGVAEDVIARTVSKVKGGNFIKRLLAAKQPAIAGMEIVTRRRIQAELIAGLRRGENVQQLADRIKGQLSDNRARALSVARTEAGQAVSAARFAAASAAGATGKGWITGANPRGTHVQAGQTYAPRSSPIPLDEPFEVGSSRLMYPRDPTGEAGEIINCNCVMVTVRLKRGEDGAALVPLNAIGAAA